MTYVRSVCKTAFAVVLALFPYACSKGSTGPSTVVPPIPAPSPVSPASGALIGDLDQPVTLVVQNPSIVPSSVVYTFDVATDAAFLTVVRSQLRTPADGERTSLVLDRLLAGTVYYWRVRAAGETGMGSVSQMASFTIGSAIASGPYQMVIDGTTTSCGGPFNQRIVLYGDLVRGPDGLGKDGFNFGRTHWPCGVCALNYDYIGMRVNFTGSAV